MNRTLKSHLTPLFSMAMVPSPQALIYLGQAALQRPQALNVAGGFAGYTDWRLPNIEELASIVELACYSPAINIAVFPSTSSYFYWSASPGGGSSYNAWGVDFVGDVGGNDRRNANRVRLVRGGQ